MAYQRAHAGGQWDFRPSVSLFSFLPVFPSSFLPHISRFIFIRASFCPFSVLNSLFSLHTKELIDSNFVLHSTRGTFLDRTCKRSTFSRNSFTSLHQRRQHPYYLVSSSTSSRRDRVPMKLQGYCEGVVGRFLGAHVNFHSRLKKPTILRLSHKIPHPYLPIRVSILPSHRGLYHHAPNHYPSSRTHCRPYDLCGSMLGRLLCSSGRRKAITT
jgi:hypothetical protein